MNKSSLFIIGSGGLGRELLAILKHTNYLSQYSEVGFIDDATGTIKGIEIVGNNDYLNQIDYNCDVIIAIGNTTIRRKIIEELSNNRYLNFPTFIHPKASIYDVDSVKIGKGCFIGEASILTTDIIIEDHCFINSNVSLHHDVIVRENCVLMPGVRITGGAEIGKDSRLGPNLQIPDTSSIPSNSNLKL